LSNESEQKRETMLARNDRSSNLQSGSPNGAAESVTSPRAATPLSAAPGAVPTERDQIVQSKAMRKNESVLQDKKDVAIGDDNAAPKNKASVLEVPAPTAAPPNYLAATPPAEQPAVAADGSKQILADGGNLAIAPAKVSQQFARMKTVSTETRDRAGKPGVLETFQVEETGNKLRIIDSDGSVYTGDLEDSLRSGGATSLASDALMDKEKAPQRFAANEPTQPTLSSPVSNGLSLSRSEMKRPAAGAPGAGGALGGARVRTALGGPTRFFRVTGTNLTLNQAVEFTGTLSLNQAAAPAAIQPEGRLKESNSTSLGVETFAIETTNASTNAEIRLDSVLAAPAPLRLSNSLLHGKVVIGNQATNSINLDATPVGR
jgi:hypothetical protein